MSRTTALERGRRTGTTNSLDKVGLARSYVPTEGAIRPLGPTGRIRMTVRIGLLGSGFVAEFYLQGLRHAADWEIPVVYSPNAAHAGAFVERWHLGGVAGSAEEVLRRGDIDLVLLA